MTDQRGPSPEILNVSLASKNVLQIIGLPHFERLAAAIVEAEVRLACVHAGADVERVARCKD